MNARVPTHSLAALHAAVHDVVERCYRARLERARRMRAYLEGRLPIEGLHEQTDNEDGDLPI